MGRPGVLRFVGSQRVGHDWATELNQTELCTKNLTSLQTGIIPSIHFTELPGGASGKRAHLPVHET